MSKITVKIPPEACGARISDYLSSKGYPVAQPCGGRGVCGKCRVQLSCGSYVSACKTLCPPEGIEVIIDESAGSGLTVSDDGSEHGERLGFAVDIGTTTVAVALVDIDSGRIIRTASALNAQQSFGADVMTRISAARDGNLDIMCRLIREQVAGLCNSISDGLTVESMTVAANNTMEHIFAGISPEGMGAYPFTPAFTGALVINGYQIGMPVIGNVTVMPSASAFVGADAVGGAVFVGLESKNAILCDIGTNGELILSYNGKLYGASAAAGPALEGANISCGIGGVAGAVSSARMQGNVLHYKTIGDVRATGVCGSGLVDIIACLYESGIMDETGILDGDEYEISGIHESSDGKTLGFGSTGLVLTQSDIREFQLAKSAVHAGILALLEAAGMKAGQLEKAYIAGGMGYYLNMQSCVSVGLFPKEFEHIYEAVGNTSLKSAVEYIHGKPDFGDDCFGYIKNCRIIELNSSKVFFEAFIENMLFPMEDL